MSWVEPVSPRCPLEMASERTPLVSWDTKKNGYSWQVGFVYIFNIMAGPGLLTLPKAFVQVGWLLGLISLRSDEHFISFINKSYHSILIFMNLIYNFLMSAQMRKLSFFFRTQRLLGACKTKKVHIVNS